MLKDIFIFILLWTGARYAWMVDLPALHEEMFRLVAENHSTLLTSAVIVVFSILLIAYLCGSLRWHTPLYLMSRFSFEVSQFVIVCISFDAVILWFDSGVNLWGQLGGVVASLPFLTLGAACYGFWMYDFNYPLQDRIARNFAMPILSGLIIGISSFL